LLEITLGYLGSLLLASLAGGRSWRTSNSRTFLVINKEIVGDVEISCELKIPSLGNDLLEVRDFSVWRDQSQRIFYHNW